MPRAHLATRLVGLAGALAGLLLSGCSNKSHEGLPPATDWQASTEMEASSGSPMTPPRAMSQARRRGMSGNPSDPHAGLDMSDPHAGLDMGGMAGGDPHAGLDMGGMGMGGGDDPHAGLDMGNPHVGGGTDVTRMGLAPPDPDRKIDPRQRVTGTLTVASTARDRAKPGTPIFLIVKRAGADGAPSGPALAVDKLAWTKDGMAFELTDANAMVAGTELAGDVIVMARYDQDSDALTKEPGDITGQVRVKIPADHIKLTLDTVLP
jgi:hypothetical protein